MGSSDKQEVVCRPDELECVSVQEELVCRVSEEVVCRLEEKKSPCVGLDRVSIGVCHQVLNQQNKS